MAIDPRRCRPGELIRLMNSTPLGAVLDARRLQKHRARAGLRINPPDDTSRIDLFRYVAWLAGERVDRLSTAPRHREGSPEPTGAARRLSVSQLAAVLGVHVNAVKYHVERGMPYSNDRRGIRRFNEPECRRWLADRGSVHYNGGNKLGAYAKEGTLEDVASKDKASDINDPDSPLGLELRLKRAKADEIETKTAERKGTLVNAQEVQAVFTTHLVSARVAFESVAVKAAGKVLAVLEADNSVHHKIVEAIKGEIDQAMQSLVEAPLK